MKSRMMRKIGVLVTGSALALSFPAAGAIADAGGKPHEGSHGKGKQNKEHGQNNHKCPGNGKGVDVNSLPDQAKNGNGKKCGFRFSDGGLQNGQEQENDLD